MNGYERDESYLQELMREFPVPSAPSLREAMFLIQERYRLLWSIFHDLDADPINSKIPIDRSDSSFLSYMIEIEASIKAIHGTLYRGILSNASHYRQEDDRHAGAVWFGGQDPFYRTIGRFQGSKPADIQSHVRDAVVAYIDNREDPLKAVCMFYQQFVQTHPFYDANGRIARLIASYFLRKHGLEIRWSEMEGKNNEFIRRLNAVHKHANFPAPYIRYLASYVRKFTHEVAMLGSTSD